MKKTILNFVALSVLAIAISSCSKKYNCHCVYTDNGSVSNETDSEISEGSKEDSQASCDKMDNTTATQLNGNTYTSTTECEITE